MKQAAREWARVALAGGVQVPSKELAKQAEARGWDRTIWQAAIRDIGGAASTRGGSTPVFYSLNNPRIKATRPKSGIDFSKPTMTAKAARWLPERLANGPVPRQVLVDEAQAMGITAFTLDTVRKDLRLTSERGGGLVGSRWSLPEAAPSVAESRSHHRPKVVPAKALALRPQAPVRWEEDEPRVRNMPPELDMGGMFGAFERMFAGDGVAVGSFDRARARHELLREMMGKQHDMMLELLRDGA